MTAATPSAIGRRTRRCRHSAERPDMKTNDTFRSLSTDVTDGAGPATGRRRVWRSESGEAGT
jgi:hypothetical protein